MIQKKPAATWRSAFLEMSWLIGKSFAHIPEAAQGTRLPVATGSSQTIATEGRFIFNLCPAWVAQPDDPKGF